MRSFDFVFHVAQTALLRTSSLLVQVDRRAEWHREWLAELWHVRRACIPVGAFSWPAQREVTIFCLGAVSDAICLHRQAEQSSASPAHVHGSAAKCVVWLSTVLLTCFAIAHFLPGIQAEYDAARIQIRPNLLLVHDAQFGRETPTISPALFRNWKATRQRYFDSFAFYRTVHETAPVPGHRISWNVAHSTYNLFPLLGLTVQLTNVHNGLPAVILSHEAWIRDFASDPLISGRVVLLGQRQVTIVGVAPSGAWSLPGQPDAWLLESDAQLAADTPSGGFGFLIAHLSPLGQAEMFGDHIPISARGIGDNDLDLDGVVFTSAVEGAWSLYSFALFLAILALPAVTSVSMGESNFSSHRPALKRRIYRFVFLFSKLALIAAIAYYASLDIAYSHSSSFSSAAECGQLISGFVICLFGFSWALADQRKRCPVCLRCVTHPAQVGLASRTFLGWNGIEMVCMGGHTLLHVPSLPTSWFDGQRWLYLDNSWDFLFADPCV